jgi:hypothetical protein
MHGGLTPRPSPFNHPPSQAAGSAGGFFMMLAKPTRMRPQKFEIFRFIYRCDRVH